MSRFYPADGNRLSTFRLFAIGCAVFAALSWVAYSWFNGDSRWENRLVSFAFICVMVVFSVADSFWPVVSVNERKLVQHRSLWMPITFDLRDVERAEGDGEMLYLTMIRGKTLAINMQRLAECDRIEIREFVAKHITGGNSVG